MLSGEPHGRGFTEKWWRYSGGVDEQAERVVFTDETGAAVDWTATKKQFPSELGRPFGGVEITRRVPAQWLYDLRSQYPERIGISASDPVELVLTLDGHVLDRWEGAPTEQVAGLIALMRANDLPVVEAT